VRSSGKAATLPSTHGQSGDSSSSASPRWLGWSVPFHWGERHLLSAALWCFYCAYLHLHFSQRWSQRGKAWFAITGAVMVFATSYYHAFIMLGVKHG
jgi:hypothetical protein